MKKQAVIFAQTLAALTLLLAGGCGALSRPYPEKSLHALNVPDPAADSATPIDAVLRVEHVHIARPFDGSCFVYKIGNSQFTTDYYNGFITSPSALITSELVNWLAKRRIFAMVLTPESGAEYQLTLETSISAMYGAFDPSNSPRAVLEVRFFVINQADGRFDVVFDKSYTQSEGLDPQLSKTDGLVKAWTIAWQRMLDSLADDLRAAPAVTSIGRKP